MAKIISAKFYCEDCHAFRSLPHDCPVKETKRKVLFFLMLLLFLFILFVIGLIFAATAHADVAHLKASWYSIASLKKEGTYKYSKGVMANGRKFNDRRLTAASRDYPLRSVLRVVNKQNGRVVRVEVSDRIGRRFKGKRIDLSKAAFAKIADLDTGVIRVKIERAND